MINRPVACALVLALSTSASGADLLEVYRQARGADATYAAARSTWAAAQERIPQGRAGLLPLASVSASTRYNDRTTRFPDSNLPNTRSDSGAADITLSVTQPLYRKQNAIVYQQAFTQVEQADAQLALAAQELILRVAQAYFDVLLAQDNVTLAQAQKTAIGQQLEQAKRNFEVGTATVTDTHEAQARFDLTVAQEIGARNDLELRRRALEQLIARAAPPLAPLRTTFPLRSPQPARMEEWVSQAQDANLQVRIALSSLTFSSQEIARNRAAHAPTVDAFATLSGSNADAGLANGARNDTRGSVVGIQVSIPIYQGGAINSRVREAIAQESRARHELEGARRNAEFSARQAYLGITSGMSQVSALEAALVSTQSQLDSTRLGRDVGVRTQVDVLNAQQLLFSASRDLAQSKYNYVLSLLRLEAAVGELTEEDLVALNQWLDREAPGAGLTPVSAPAGGPAAPAPAAVAADVPAKALQPQDPAAVLGAVQDWARAWAANDVAGYLAHYGADFVPPRGTRQAWEGERRARVGPPRRIAVAIESPSVEFDGQGRAVVAFRQHYRSGTLDVTSSKTLVLTRETGRWLIREERVREEKHNPREAPAAAVNRSSPQSAPSALAR